jgi:hypothetical protein
MARWRTTPLAGSWWMATSTRDVTGLPDRVVSDWWRREDLVRLPDRDGPISGRRSRRAARGRLVIGETEMEPSAGPLRESGARTGTPNETS